MMFTDGRADVANVKDSIKNLRRILDILPVTKDNFSAIPGDILYHPKDARSHRGNMVRMYGDDPSPDSWGCEVPVEIGSDNFVCRSEWYDVSEMYFKMENMPNDTK